jgi:hypothetical protein
VVRESGDGWLGAVHCGSMLLIDVQQLFDLSPSRRGAEHLTLLHAHLQHKLIGAALALLKEQLWTDGPPKQRKDKGAKGAQASHRKAR